MMTDRREPREDGAMGKHDDDEDDDATVPVQIGESGPALCPTCGCPLEDLYDSGILMCPKCVPRPSLM
jgi:hypothetical protein